MTADPIGDIARRRALRRGVDVGLGVTIALAGLRGAVAQTRLAKEAVRYTDSGAAPGKDCDDCSQFVAGRGPTDAGTCKIVAGAISPHGHCIAFSPKRPG